MADEPKPKEEPKEEPNHWTKGAIKHPGALTASAKRAGKSPMEFAREHEHSKGTLGRRARLAETLHKMHSR